MGMKGNTNANGIEWPTRTVCDRCGKVRKDGGETKIVTHRLCMGFS